MNQPPEPWSTAIIRAGYTDPRYKDDRPSMGALATAAGLHTTTVSRMVRGIGKASQDNVAAVAGALGVDVVTVSEWVKQARSESKPYTPPPEVNLLSRREQDALTELIRAVAAREDRKHDPSTTTTEREPTDTESDPEEQHDAQQQRTTRKPVRGSVTRSRAYPGRARSASRQPQTDDPE